MTPKTTKSCQCRRFSQACQTTTPRARNGTTVTSPVAIRSAVSFAQGSMSCALTALCIPRPFCGERPGRLSTGFPVTQRYPPLRVRVTQKSIGQRPLADAAARAALQLGDLERHRVDHLVEVGDRADVAVAHELRRRAGLADAFLQAAQRVLD